MSFEIKKSAFTSSVEARSSCFDPQIKRTPSSEELYRLRISIFESAQGEAQQTVDSHAVDSHADFNPDDIEQYWENAIPYAPSSAPPLEERNLDSTSASTTSTQTNSEEKAEFSNLTALLATPASKAAPSGWRKTVLSYIPGFLKHSSADTSSQASIAAVDTTEELYPPLAGGATEQLKKTNS